MRREIDRKIAEREIAFQEITEKIGIFLSSYPELGPELTSLIERQAPGAGYRSCEHLRDNEYCELLKQIVK